MNSSNCGTGYTVWTTGDGQTGGNTAASSMCIVVQTFKAAGFTATNRYTGGCMSSSNITAANTNVNNLYTFYQSANTLYTNQRTTLNSASGSKVEGEAMLTKFFNQIADYNTLATDFSTYYSFINAFSNTSTALKSCQFFRDDMLIFSNTICFKTVSAFADQTIWIVLMGPTMCLMSICMFAAIRCPFKKKEDDNKTQPQNNYVAPNNYGQGTQFQNVDKNVNNNYYQPQNQQQTGYPSQQYGQVGYGQPAHGLDI